MAQKIRVLVAGASGQLSQALQALDDPRLEIIARGRPELDILQADSVARVMEQSAPDAVINTAAYTAVDDAEAKIDDAFALNRDAAGLIASAAAQRGAAFIHISSDYVFNGRKRSPYVETDAPDPVNVYGRSKLAGEQVVAQAHPDAVIARPAWLMGPYARCFPAIMLTLAQSHDAVRVVTDQRGSPTHADDLARALAAVVAARVRGEGAPGVLHLAGSEPATWRDIAEAVFEEAQACGAPTARVRPVTSAAFGSPAARPADSRLDSSAAARLYGVAMPGWRAGLRALVRGATATPAPV